MKTYETTATVKDHGEIHVADVPFEPGTEVEIRIRRKSEAPGAEEANAPASMKELFARVRARNRESVGSLRREELYDRKVLR